MGTYKSAAAFSVVSSSWILAQLITVAEKKFLNEPFWVWQYNVKLLEHYCKVRKQREGHTHT